MTPISNRYIGAVAVTLLITNMYTAETYEGKRLQRFLYKGIGPAAK
jgi:hypothetical protein